MTPLSSPPMKSFLSYVVACNFTEKELVPLFKFLRILHSYSRYSVTLHEKSHA